jgi:hypothetical protein
MDAYVTVHLDDRAPWRDIRTGRLAANADIQACLSALDALLLRGSFYAGPERTFLKNVTLTALHVTSSVERSSSSASVNPISHPSSVQSSGHDTNVLQVAFSVHDMPFYLMHDHSSYWSLKLWHNFGHNSNKLQKQHQRQRYTLIRTANDAMQPVAVAVPLRPFPCSQSHYSLSTLF